MRPSQDRFVRAATLLSESAWLYAAFALVGLMAGREGSPLGWLAVLAVLGSSYLVTRGLQIVAMPNTVAHTLTMLAGVLAIYLTLGTQVDTGGSVVDLGWAGELGSDTGDSQVAVLGGLLSVLLWWRGSRTASIDDSMEGLETSFRLGVVAVAVAAVVEVFHHADLRVFPLMFLFFASGLAGLGAGRILAPSQNAVRHRTWPKAIAAVVSAVLATGLLFSLIDRSVLSLLSRPILGLLDMLRTAVFYVVVVPVAYLVGWIVAAVKALVNLIGGGEGQPVEGPRGGGLSGLQELREEAAAQDPSPLAQALEWALVAILVLALLYLPIRVFRRRPLWRRRPSGGTRESVVEGADPAYDMAKLLFGLMPRRFRRAKRRHALLPPDDDPGVVEVFKIYFGLLSLAEKKGFPRRPAETPTEYRRMLERILPPNLAGAVTAAFNRACYGRHPASPRQIEEMRASLERLASGAYG